MPVSESPAGACGPQVQTRRSPADCDAAAGRSDEVEAARETPPGLPVGSIPALVTPMLADGALDWDAYGALIDWHVGAGSDALSVMGTTGESATVSIEEHGQLIERAIAQADGRIPIIAGTGANSTSEAIELTQHARLVGAVAALSVTPYYNRPTQDGLYAHFRAVAEAVDLPLILYNVPGRTGVDLADETILRLAEIPNIAGLKDATGDIGRANLLMSRLPPGFAIYSGDDPTAAALMLLGARGNISVTANVIPKIMSQLCAAARAGDVASVRAVSRRIAQLHDALFVESNPIPVKWALARLGRLSAHYRLPLTPLSAARHEIVAEALRLAGEDA